MLYFKNDHFGETICMESTLLGDMRIQTVMDSGFLLYPKKRDPVPHSHLNYELYFTKRGSCQTVCAGKTYTSAAGDMFLIPRGEEHSVQSQSADACIYSLRFSVFPIAAAREEPLLYDTFLAQIKTPVLLTKRNALSAPLCQIREELAHKSVLCSEKIPALLTLFYAELFRALTETDSPSTDEEFSVVLKEAPGYLRGRCKDTPQEFYIDILDSFFTHLPHEPTLEMLWGHLHLSIRQTRRLVQEHYGMPFRQKLSKTRIDTAKRLIRTTDFPLEAVAEKAGYASYNAFFEAFMAQTGLSPSQYKKATRTPSP